MFFLKSYGPVDSIVTNVSIDNLSSFDVNVVVEYSIPIDSEDRILYRMVGRANGSALEITLVDGYISEVGLRCFDGSVSIYPSTNWTRPESSKNKVYGFRLSTKGSSEFTKLGESRIDQYTDFDMQIFSDAIVFRIAFEEIAESINIQNKLSVLLNDAGTVVGFAVLSEDHAARLGATYSS